MNEYPCDREMVQKKKFSISLALYENNEGEKGRDRTIHIYIERKFVNYEFMRADIRAICRTMCIYLYR